VSTSKEKISPVTAWNSCRTREKRTHSNKTWYDELWALHCWQKRGWFLHLPPSIHLQLEMTNERRNLAEKGGVRYRNGNTPKGCLLRKMSVLKPRARFRWAWKQYSTGKIGRPAYFSQTLPPLVYSRWRLLKLLIAKAAHPVWLLYGLAISVLQWWRKSDLEQ
jgi:hypothetical protein